MPRNRRRPVLIAFAWIMALYPQGKASAQASPTSAAEAVQKPSSEQVREIPAAYRPKCQNPKTREESELCAQWAAALAARQANALALQANEAAREANAVSAETLWWTRVGLFAVIATLLATAWAAWAAGSAARAAHESLSLFKDAEAGYLVGSVVFNNSSVLTVGLVNKGRTPVTIFHADICYFEERPTKPIEAFLTGQSFKTDVLIGTDTPYLFGDGPLAIPGDASECWLCGGALYRTIFGQVRLARVAVHVDRKSGRITVDHKINFAKWIDLGRKTFGKSFVDS